MEFKGTKGRWILEEYKNDFSVTSECKSWIICQSVTKDKQDMYNALLISKAPEMLEMLEDVREDLVDLGRLDKAFKIDELINQATEL